MHLGSLGAEKPPVDVTFDYFGETIHANPELCELDYGTFMERAGAVDVDAAPAVAWSMLREFAATVIAPDDIETFWSTAKRNRQGIRDVFDVAQAVIEAVSDRPTERPSSSADTPGNADTSSGLSSSVRERLEGRPDLELLVLDAQEARARRAS